MWSNVAVVLNNWVLFISVYFPDLALILMLLVGTIWLLRLKFFGDSKTSSEIWLHMWLYRPSAGRPSPMNLADLLLGATQPRAWIGYRPGIVGKVWLGPDWDEKRMDLRRESHQIVNKDELRQTGRLVVAKICNKKTLRCWVFLYLSTWVVWLG